MKAISVRAKEPKRKLDDEELSNCGLSCDIAVLLGSITAALGESNFGSS